MGGSLGWFEALDQETSKLNKWIADIAHWNVFSIIGTCSKSCRMTVYWKSFGICLKCRGYVLFIGVLVVIETKIPWMAYIRLSWIRFVWIGFWSYERDSISQNFKLNLISSHMGFESLHQSRIFQDKVERDWDQYGF